MTDFPLVPTDEQLQVARNMCVETGIVSACPVHPDVLLNNTRKVPVDQAFTRGAAGANSHKGGAMGSTRAAQATAWAGLTVLLTAGAVVAQPDTFSYKTFGVSEYSLRGGGVGDLDVELMHDSLSSAVDSHEASMDCESVVDNGYNDAIYNYDLEEPDASINDYDFALLHVHGDPPDCGTNTPPVYLGNCGNCSVDMDDLDFGQDGDLRWLWAASCSWFDLDAWRDDTRIWGTTSTLTCSDGTAELDLPDDYQQPAFDATGYYDTSGVSVDDSTTLSGCGSGDYYTLRITKVEQKGPDEYDTTYAVEDGSHGGLNRLVVKGSLPGLPWVEQATVSVYLRDPDGTTPQYLVASLTFNGTGGGVATKEADLSDRLEDYGFGQFVHEKSLHLAFSSCTRDLTIHGVYFYYDPMTETGIVTEMQDRVDCMATVFGGCHAIMGWSNISQANYDRKRISPFLDRWVDYDFSITEAFFGVGTNSGEEPTAPAIAVAVGSGVDKYKYLLEPWSTATNAAAPEDSCMICWCVPYFHNPSDGYYWVEE